MSSDKRERVELALRGVGSDGVCASVGGVDGAELQSPSSSNMRGGVAARPTAGSADDSADEELSVEQELAAEEERDLCLCFVTCRSNFSRNSTLQHRDTIIFSNKEARYG